MKILLILILLLLNGCALPLRLITDNPDTPTSFYLENKYSNIYHFSGNYKYFFEAFIISNNWTNESDVSKMASFVKENYNDDWQAMKIKFSKRFEKSMWWVDILFNNAKPLYEEKIKNDKR